ncbi:transposase [Kocuria sp. CPCC 205315]|uniref:transposase n=1 Tax=Kocuria nitroreducens TaxID=3058914 RepID=UPI0036D91688
MGFLTSVTPITLLASPKHWDELARGLKPALTAPTAAAAEAALAAVKEKWGAPCPAISRPWRGAWAEFVPFLDDDVGSAG